jgi:serine/threonine protein kinase
MFHEGCKTAHAKLLYGKCQWCGKLIVEGKRVRDPASESRFLTLEQLVNFGTRELTPKEAATLLVQIAEAVAAHADSGRLALYPAAICLADDGKVQLRSIYRLADDESADAGLVDYLAPEQALDSHRADSRADIYSLGCIMYFLLTRQPPFSDGSVAERLLQHQKEMPAPIASRRGDVPESLDAIVSKMLAKRPEDRYQSAEELAEAIRTWLKS